MRWHMGGGSICIWLNIITSIDVIISNCLKMNSCVIGYLSLLYEKKYVYIKWFKKGIM